MLKKLRSIFIIDDEEAAGNTEQVSTPEPAGESHKVMASAADATPRKMVKVKGGEVSEKFLNILLEAMDANDLEGFDYLEFKKFLKSLDKVELDEATKFRTAFATGQTMGATRDNLVSSARRYLDVLGQEESRFEQAVQNQRSKVSEEMRNGIAAMEKQIAGNEETIAKLKAENDKARTEIASRREEIEAAETRIQETQNDFEQTYRHLVGQLQDDIEKINKFLA